MLANVKATAPKAKAPKAVTLPAIVAPKAPSAKALAQAAHDAAGFTGNSYDGLSKPRNAGSTAAPNLATSKAAPRTHAQLTPRMLSTLRELAKAYGASAFPLPGIDRGQAAIFIASGFFIAGDNNTATLSPDCVQRYS